MNAYFRRTGPRSFQPTGHVGGGWNPDEQHIAPVLGLLAHVVEIDAANRGGGDRVLSRLSYDILGTIPMEEVTAGVDVLRPGRTIELVEGTLSHAGRPAVRLRAWFQATRDTSGVAGSRLETMPSRDELPEWDATETWPGGFIASVRGHRRTEGPGRTRAWIRTDLPLVDAEPVGPVSAVAGLVDIANGLAALADPTQVLFPNLDLTLHLVRSPVPGWLGFDTSVAFGPTGLGLTSTVLHDEDGPVGTVSQTLTVRVRD